MKSYFSGSSYDTPQDRRRALGDRLFLNSRLYFAGGYIREVFRSRSIALRGLYDRAEWAESSHRVFRLIEDCGGHFHLRGLDNLKSGQGPFVYVSNHMSTLETMTFPCMIAPFMEVTFVVKESLAKHLLFGPIMRARNPILVKRSNPREDFQTVMTKGNELLAKGTSIIIFPQSTRSAEFIPDEFNSLGVKLARAAGVQIIPVAIKTDFWGNGRYLRELGPLHRSCPIRMVFGKPFPVAGNGKEEHKKVIDFIISHLIQWGALIKSAQ